MSSQQSDERADLRKWRERRSLESSARKPRNRKKYYRAAEKRNHKEQ